MAEWTFKCAETPALVARHVVAVLAAATRRCQDADSGLPLVSLLSSTVHGDWLAGAELLRAAVATSVHNVRLNLKAKKGQSLDAASTVLLEEVDVLEEACAEMMATIH